MRILLLGATGRTGKWVRQLALEGGHDLTCLIRDASKLDDQPPQLKLLEGMPNEFGSLAEAVDDCDAIISVLNVSRKSDFPWAPLRTPDHFLSEVMGHLIPIATEKGVKRLVICSAWGAAETKKDIPGWFRWFIDNSNIGAAYRDHERQEALVEGSNLDWTIVRPVGLTNSRKQEAIRETLNNSPKPGLTISRQSVARYMLQCVEKNERVGEKVTISKE